MISRSTQFTITLFIEAFPDGTIYLCASDGITDSNVLVGDACLSLLDELNKIIEVPVGLDALVPVPVPVPVNKSNLK